MNIQFFLDLVPVRLPRHVDGTIFQNKAIKRLSKLLSTLSQATIRGMVAGTDSAYFQSLDLATKEKVAGVIVDAISQAYVIVIAAGALTLLLSLFLPVSHTLEFCQT